MKQLLIIDRDGTLIKEAPPTYQIDSFSKLEFYPAVFHYLGKIARELNFELIMVSNQDGLGTDSFPEEKFNEVQEHIVRTFENEGIDFSDILIDRSFAKENSPNRKPGTGMLSKYINNPDYDLTNSFVIGDRITDVLLAKNLGCKAIWLNNDPQLGSDEVETNKNNIKDIVAVETTNWEDVYMFLKVKKRNIKHSRNTNETKVDIEIDLDGNGESEISTGLGFFNHMLEQIARHARVNLSVTTKGDLHIDEHHTIEDTGIALGEAFAKLLSDKTGLERYGFALPMDDAEAKVLIDFGGRNWIVWNANFTREKVGDMPTEMFYHFFKSFSDAAKCNLNIECKGDNEHHKIEAIFKAFAKAIRMAIKKDPFTNYLPTTKGII